MIEWKDLFSFSLAPVEIVVRGSAMFWFLFGLFRFVLRRDVGAISVADLLVLVVIADAAQNGMAGDYHSVADAFLLVATLAFWNFLLDWLSYHVPGFRRFSVPPAILLIEDGRILKRNLRREFITQDELMSELRANGIEKVEEVKRAYMEPSGAVSVIRRKQDAGSSLHHTSRERPDRTR